jgi:glycosyltransferase involved in cell wall biosynthesis
VVASTQEENDVKKQIDYIPLISTLFGSNLSSDIFKNNPKGCNLLAVSRIDPIKNLEFVIALAANISRVREGVTLRIIGGGDRKYLAYLKNISSEIYSSNQIEFIEQKSSSEVKEHIESADIFVQLSLYENYGIAVAESVSCNTPVLVSVNMGISEFISESKAGVAVSTDNLEQATRAVLDILSNYRTFVANCQLSKQDLNWNNIFTKLMDKI